LFAPYTDYYVKKVRQDDAYAIIELALSSFGASSFSCDEVLGWDYSEL
jgi:hypothetical protein